MGTGGGPTPGDRPAALAAGDALRAWALMSVVVFHIAGGVLLLTTGSYDFQAGYGRVAGSLMWGMQTTVFIFFALSAYLLSRPFIAAALHGTPMPSARRYGRHRVGRIVPAFWVAVVVMIAAYGTQGSGIKDVVALLLFAQVYHHGPVDALIDHAWSLNVEMLFYLLLPLVAAACAFAVRRWTHGRAIAAAGILALAGGGVLLQHVGLSEGTQVTQSPLGGLRAFLPGIALAVLVVRRPDPAAWRSLPGWLAPALALTGVVLLWAAPHWGESDLSLRVFLGTASGGCILAAVVIRQYRDAHVAWFFRGRVVAWAGERSYSIFLVHGLVIWALHDVGEGQGVWRRLAITLVLTLPAIMVAAEILHRLVERPAMNHSRRPRASDRRPVMAPPVLGTPATAVLALAAVAPVAAAPAAAAVPATPAAP